MSNLSKKTILIIENNETHHAVLTNTLSDLYDIIVFKTGHDAVSYYKQSTTPIDLILLSIDTADMPTLDIYNQCYEHSKESTPHIILTIPNNYTGDWVTPFTEIQSFYCLEKPFIESDLLTTIKNALLHSSLTQNQPIHSFRPPLNSLLAQFNTKLISKKCNQLSQKSLRPSDITSDILHFEDIVSHPEGLGFIVSALEKETGQTAPEPEPSTTLIVEDEVSISELTEEYFEIKKKPIIAAKTLAEAIVCLKENPTIDVIILDLNLPDGAGYPLLTAIQENCAPPRFDSVFKCLSLPDIIIVSAYTDKAIVNQCLEAGANSYMIKPLSLAEQYNTVQKLKLRRHRLRAIEGLCGKV